MRFLLTLSVVLTSLTLTVDAQSSRGTARKVPRQVTLAEAPPPPSAKEEIISLGTVIEKYISDYDIKADGTGTETRTIQQRCLNAICIARAAGFRQIFNGNLQTIKVLDAHVLKPDGTQLKVPASAITNRPTDQTEAAPGFSSLREFSVNFAELKVGDALFLKFETVTTRPTFDGHFDALEVFPILYDWKSIEVNVTGPAGVPLFIESTGLDGGKLADENGKSRWQYKKLDVAKIAFEPAMRDLASVSPRFALTTFRDAGALGSVFWENVRAKAIVTPEIQALADEITKNSKTPVQSASAIYEWANKNIRYLLVVLDRGGWNPHSSTEIVKNGYGDCKDYVTIIHTLLKAKGIDSVPVLIRSDHSNWFPAVATADYFNHAILYIPSLDLFADATTPNTRLGLIPQALVGKRAILAGEKTGIIQLPKDNPIEDQIHSEMTLDFTADGGVTARSKNTYHGRAEIMYKPLFAAQAMKGDSSTFIRMLLAFYGINGSGKIVRVGEATKVGEPFRVEFEANVDNMTAFLPKGKLQIPPGLNIVSTPSLEQLITTDSRKTSIFVGASTIREEITVNLPTGVQITAPPAPVNFSNPVGSLKASAESKNGGLVYTRELVFSKDVVEPGEYPLLKELVKKLLAGNNLEFDYSSDPSLRNSAAKKVVGKPAARTATTVTVGSDPVPAEFKERMFAASLTPAAVRQMEKKLIANPNDAETRIQLIKHYASRGNWMAEASHVQHRIWLIKNRPEISDDELYGVSHQKFTRESVDLLKNAWLTAVAESKDSIASRMRAILALKQYSPETASKLAEDGAKADPENYELLLLSAEIDAGLLGKSLATDVIARRILVYGGRALAQIKKDRTHQRDGDRASLLKYLGTAALKVNDLDAATAFAQELVLNFGQSRNARVYDEASHVGNTTLGLVEIRRNNIARAKDHLLASIRAPLRMEYNNLSKIDTTLARELFEKGEKDVVVEYLKLCLEIQNFKIYPESYANEVYALELWISQIEKGTKPNFDFSASESQLPISKGIIPPARKSKRRQE